MPNISLEARLIAPRQCCSQKNAEKYHLALRQISMSPEACGINQSCENYTDISAFSSLPSKCMVSALIISPDRGNESKWPLIRKTSISNLWHWIHSLTNRRFLEWFSAYGYPLSENSAQSDNSVHLEIKSFRRKKRRWPSNVWNLKKTTSSQIISVVSWSLWGVEMADSQACFFKAHAFLLPSRECHRWNFTNKLPVRNIKGEATKKEWLTSWKSSALEATTISISVAWRVWREAYYYLISSAQHCRVWAAARSITLEASCSTII